MTPRFVGLFANTEAARPKAQALAEQVRRTLALEVRLSLPNAQILAAPEVAVRKAGGTGVVLGRLFKASPGFEAAPSALEPGLLDAPADGLVRRYWGEYVAIAVAPDDGVLVLRDPSGAVPVYYGVHDGLAAFVSDLALWRELSLFSDRPSSEFLSQVLSFPLLRLPATGVEGVLELLAGQVARVGAWGAASGAIQLHSGWAPWSHAKVETGMSFDEASQAVGAAVRDSVSALARGCGPMAMRLSGGLDSSLVATSLHQAGRRPTCIHLHAPGPGGDERRYAQAVAEDAGFDLVVASPSPAPMSDAPHPPTFRPPSGLRLLEGVDRALSSALAGLDAQAVFTGSGGDSVFLHLNSVTPAADRLRAFGPGRRFWRTASEIASIRQVTTWAVASRSLRHVVRPRPPWRVDLRFLDPDTALYMPKPHPWLADPAGPSPGRTAHIHAILGIQNHVDPALRPSPVPLVNPLLSQPVMEACLKVPSWLWVAGGADRAVARAAFSGQTPELVLQRRGKGRLESYCGQVYALSRTKLQEVLLDGLLAQRGLLDLPAIQSYLDAPGAPRDAGFYRLFELADVELWLRGWSTV